MDTSNKYLCLAFGGEGGAQGITPLLAGRTVYWSLPTWALVAHLGSGGEQKAGGDRLGGGVEWDPVQQGP